MKGKHDISEEELNDIENYIDGTMTAGERASFEKKIGKDKSLENAIAEFDVLFQGIKAASLKEKMETFHRRMLSGETARETKKGISRDKKTPPVLRYLMAASVAILLLLGGWWLYNRPSENERIFAEYFYPDPGLITPMSSQADYVFYDAMVDYKRGEYEKAIQKWESLLAKKPFNDTLNYFMGMGHLANGNAPGSIPFLEKSIEQKESVFLNEAYFYLGMAQLKMGNEAQARSMLEKSGLETARKVLSQMENEL